MNQQQFDRMKHGKGIVAALDQSGGSTPKALQAYGIDESAYSNEDEMFALVHQMRTRMITSPAFNADKILAAILFKDTMERQIEGKDTADYLWEVKGIVPFLKVDSGLADEVEGVQLMKPLDGLAGLLDRATEKHIFGTKMRSVIHNLNEAGIKSVVKQQFEVAHQIIEKDLVPIIEPEVNIQAENKAAIEELLEKEIRSHLNLLSGDQLVMLKLTLPEQNNLYENLTAYTSVLRVLALSGGYSQDEAERRLAENNEDGNMHNNITASFLRALAEGLSANQSQEEFDATLASSIEGIYQASTK